MEKNIEMKSLIRESNELYKLSRALKDASKVIEKLAVLQENEDSIPEELLEELLEEQFGKLLVILVKLESFV